MSLYTKHPALLPRFWGESPEYDAERKRYVSREEAGRRKKLERAFKKMTNEEKYELAMWSTAGAMIPDGDGFMILRGSHLYEKQREFEDQMISKYEG